MIGTDPATAAVFRDRFLALSPRGISDERELAQTAVEPGFPGAVLPLSRDGLFCEFYAVASTMGDWRRLRPLLIAFCGPTVSNFKGFPSELRLDDAAEALLAKHGFSAVARLRPSEETKTLALRAMLRLREMLAQAPASTSRPPEATSRLLAILRDALNASNTARAITILEQCRREQRLDALNLRFLEIEIHAAVRDWPAIISLPGLSSLLQTRRPPAVTAAILEAFYQVELADFESGHIEHLVARYRGLRPRLNPLIDLPAPPQVGSGGWTILALEVLCAEPRRPDLERAFLGGAPEDHPLRQALIDFGHQGRSGDSGPQTGHAAVAAALAQAHSTPSLSALERALSLLSELSDEDRRTLLSAEPLRRMHVEAAAEAGAKGPPQDWCDWLSRLDDSGFTSAVSMARRAASEWQVEEQLADPTSVKALASALGGVSENSLAADRLADALPYLVAYLRRDPDYPRPALLPLYETVFTIIAIGSRRGSPFLESAALLSRAMLSVGLSAPMYRQHLDDILEIAGEGLGKRSLLWLLDLVDETIAATAPDAAARADFWSKVLTRVEPLQRELNDLAVSALSRLAPLLGWDATRFQGLRGSADEQRREDGLAATLAGKRISIYTLTESAGRQAKDMLADLAPDADVQIASDHVGSPRLKTLAESSDLFVVVTWSAKHAATDFIMRHRNGKPVLYAAGRGVTSILRAIDEFLTGQFVPGTVG